MRDTGVRELLQVEILVGIRLGSGSGIAHTLEREPAGLLMEAESV